MRRVRMKVALQFTLTCGFFVFFSVSHAHAYIDPFTGGIIYQVFSFVFVSLVAAIYFVGDKIKKIFQQVKNIFIKS